MHLMSWKLQFLLLVSSCYSLPDGDLCRWMNGRKYYIDAGESGIISAENVTSQTAMSSKDNGNESNQPQIPQRCSVELITCPSCHFRVKALRINIPTCSSDNSCRCDFVWVKEAAYSKSGQEFCGLAESNSSSGLVFESKTKLVSVDFLYSGTYKSAFALQFSAINNLYVYKGGYGYYPTNNSGVVSSPNFPGGYPSDYSAEYVIQNIDSTGFVQLLFTDFQLSLWSYMEILDSNGSRIDVYNGNTFRPPALISSGPMMTVKFQANDEYPSSGFKATYNFVGYSEKYWINRPSTECGGFVEDYGGAITMMNMVPSNMMRAFDCIWLIHPRNAHVPGKQVSVRVSQFDDMGPKSTLAIRQGLYSESPLLESVTPLHHHKMHRGQEYVVSASVGLYIRLVGFFSNKSRLAIIYSTFHYDSCFSVGDYECANGRCVKNTLRCDGFNHCGDGSDEASCYGGQQGTPSPEDANWWRTLTPNYYFPKSESGNSTGTNTLILVTSLAGLGMFVLTTVVILVKLHKQRQDDSISREILQTISADIVDIENSPRHHTLSDPPMYDPPPSYDDVIKFYLPPPPAYSSIGRNGSQARGPSANGDHRPDGLAVIKGRVRRKKLSRQNNSMSHETHPVVLHVALPEEDIERNVLVPPKKSHRDSRSRSHSAAPNITLTSSPNTDGSERSAVDPSESLNSTGERLVPNDVASRSQSEHYNRKPGRTQSESATPSSFCGCQGACCCSPRTHRASDGRELPVTVSNLQEEGSFVNNNSKEYAPSSSVPFPHPEKMTVTVRTPRSKSFGDENKSNPCSRTERKAEEVKVPCKVVLKRSSSDPSELICPDENSDACPDTTSAINISQVRNLASAILGGLQHSLTFRNSSSDSASETDQGKDATNKRDNTPSSSWGTLWKRSDDEDQCKPIESDTQPLIRWALPKNGHDTVVCKQNYAIDDVLKQNNVSSRK